MKHIQVDFEVGEVQDESHVDTILNIVEASINLRLEYINTGKGQLHPVDWSNILTEHYLRMVSTINDVVADVAEGEEVPEKYITSLLQALIHINAASLGALQNLTYGDLTYDADSSITSERVGTGSEKSVDEVQP